MAVSKQDAVSKLTREQVREVDALEVTIDLEINTRYDGSDLWISTNWPHAKVQKAIKDRYEAAGWKVEFHSDQRDGSSIKLS